MINLILSSTNTNSITQILEKIMKVGLPIAIALLVFGAIFALIKAAGEGMFSSDSEMRKEVKRKYLFIFISLAVGILASGLVYAFKEVILGIS